MVYSNVSGMAVVKNATKGKQKKRVEPAPKADTDASQWLKGTNANFGDARAKPRAKPRAAAAEPAVVSTTPTVVTEAPKAK